MNLRKIKIYNLDVLWIWSLVTFERLVLKKRSKSMHLQHKCVPDQLTLKKRTIFFCFFVIKWNKVIFGAGGPKKSILKMQINFIFQILWNEYPISLFENRFSFPKDTTTFFIFWIVYLLSWKWCAIFIAT